MRKLLFTCLAALLGGAFVLGDADAARLGGARSLGAQRSVARSAPARTPSAAPAAAPAPQNAAAQPAAPAQPAASPGGGWLPALGGLAVGGLLRALFGGGGALGGLVMLALVALSVLAVVRALAPRREAPRALQYAGDAAWPVGTETVAAPPPSQAAGFEAPAPAAAASVPPGFDVAGFLKSAKLNFMKLQLANDRGDLDELREFTSPELFEELRKDVLARGSARRQTDVLALSADLLELVTEAERHWASVRFAGSVRESPAEAPSSFEEVWNLAKPVDGSTGWLLAGIQQMH